MRRTKEEIERDHKELVNFLGLHRLPGEVARDHMRQYNARSNDPDYCAQQLMDILAKKHDVRKDVIDNGERNKSETKFWMQKYIEFSKLPCAENMAIRSKVNDKLTEMGKEKYGVDKTTLRGYRMNHNDYEIAMEVHKDKN